jgi:hypothetical protein
MNLDAEDVEAVAARVVQLLSEWRETPVRYVDAAALARTLKVKREWVYAHARELGGLRLGDGPKAPLRFDLERVCESLTERDGARPSLVAPPLPRGRGRGKGLPRGVNPIRERPTQ